MAWIFAHLSFYYFCNFEINHFARQPFVKNLITACDVNRTLDHNVYGYDSSVTFKTGKFRFEDNQGLYSSVVSSAPTILRPGFESQAHHLCFFNLYWNCNEKRTKLNKKRPGFAHLKKIKKILRWNFLNRIGPWIVSAQEIGSIKLISPLVMDHNLQPNFGHKLWGK